MLFSKIAIAGDIFEVVSFKFKDNVSLTDQKKSMLNLNPIVSKFAGFKSRDYYYSDKDKLWLDFVVWESLEQAEEASKKIMETPQAGEIFSLIDDKSITFSHYDRINGTNKS